VREAGHGEAAVPGEIAQEKKEGDGVGAARQAD
jgi:hypothetical protein